MMIVEGIKDVSCEIQETPYGVKSLYIYAFTNLSPRLRSCRGATSVCSACDTLPLKLLCKEIHTHPDVEHSMSVDDGLYRLMKHHRPGLASVRCHLSREVSAYHGNS